MYPSTLLVPRAGTAGDVEWSPRPPPVRPHGLDFPWCTHPVFIPSAYSVAASARGLIVLVVVLGRRRDAQNVSMICIPATSSLHAPPAYPSSVLLFVLCSLHCLACLLGRVRLSSCLTRDP